ncbi:MAG: hypothetical protein ACMXYD_01115 [Candidatus Woesearchaeota archaeon]
MARQDKVLRKYKNYIKAFIAGFFALAILTTYYGLDDRYYTFANEWFFAVLLSLVLSYIVAVILVTLTGGLFIRKLRVWKVSVPLFPILVVAVKYFLFGGL